MFHNFIIIIQIFIFLKNSYHCFGKSINLNTENAAEEIVAITPLSSVKQFQVPTSEDPLLSWIEVQKGSFPNTSLIKSNISIGEPLTLFIYFADKSYLYDLKVTDCWAYDNGDFEHSKNKIHLLTNEGKSSIKSVDKWHRIDFKKGNPLKTLMYTGLKSFKFPDKDQIFISCDIQLCFKTCNVTNTEHLQ